MSVGTEFTQSVRAFFETYTREFDSADGARIADLYHAPSITLRGDGSIHAFQTHEEIRNFFQNVADTYRSEGYRSGRFDNFTAIPIGSRSALATLDWDILREDGSPIRRWRQSYNLVRVGEQWKIMTAMVHQS